MSLITSSLWQSKEGHKYQLMVTTHYFGKRERINLTVSPGSPLAPDLPWNFMKVENLITVLQWLVTLFARNFIIKYGKMYSTRCVSCKKE